MKLRYDGPIDEVDVPELGVSVKRGQQVEATGKVADSLLEQGWRRVAPPKKTAAKKTAATKPAGGSPAADQNEE